MTTYAHKAAVVDRLLAEWGMPPDNVLAVYIYSTDVVIHTKAPLEKVEWTVTARPGTVEYRCDVLREEVPIRVTASLAVQEAAA